MNSVYLGEPERRFLFIVIKRRQIKPIDLRFKNMGTKAWFDISKTKSSLGKIAPVTPMLFDDTEDFFVRPGDSPEKASKLFKSVTGSKGKPSDDRHVADPGEIVTVPVMVVAQRYTRPGIYRVRIGLSIDDATKAAVSKPATVTAAVWRLPSIKITLRDTWRALKLNFIKKGKVDYYSENKVFNQRSHNAVPVVMCTWKRIENLQKTIELLRNQTQPTVFYIWNNNKEMRGEIDEIVKKEKILPIHVSHSSYNIGGFGRFYQARNIANEYNHVVFIDDDQTFDRHTVKDFKKEAKPKSIYSQWSYRIKDVNNYWRRRDTEKDEQAHYIGTCGMISDINIFKNERLYTCPHKYWFVEDFWLSYIADTERWKLRKSKVKFNTHDDGKDQMNFLIDKKIRMFKYLIDKKGWKTTV
jgi:hypothetical protein